MLTHREARPDDVPLVCSFPQSAEELFFLFPKATYPLTPEQLSRAIAQRFDSTVALLDGAPCAFANFYLREVGGTCAIGNVVVAPYARGKGVGRYLVETMVRKALADHRAAEVRISCFNRNVAGLLLYPKLGFVPYAIEQRLDPHGEKVALVHLRLGGGAVKARPAPLATPPDAAPPVRIRPVTPADTDAVVALWRVVFPEYGDPRHPQRSPAASVARKLAFGDGLFWLAERDGKVVGTAMAGYDGHRGWLYSVGVRPDLRGGGIARALVADAERALAARGCPKVNLQVFAANEAAQAFWRRVGYAQDAVVSLGKRLGSAA